MTPTPFARLSLESLDERVVPSATAFDRPDPAPTVVYTETNDPRDGQNAVLAFRRDPLTGDLTQLGRYLTGGTGQLNVPKAVGQDDGDQQVRVTADGKFLFAVNQGSHSVTAFRVLGSGRLEKVGTYASGGDQPDSVGVAGNYLYVANRGDASSTHPGTTTPNVTAFSIGRDGSLTPVANSTVNFPVGTFVTQTLVSKDGRFLFVEAATLSGTAGGNTVNTFRINADGTLTAAPGGPASAGTNAPVLLGAATHPTLNIVYTGFASAKQVGVFTYDETGRTSYVGPAADSGAAPCWCVVSEDGKVLYVANTATDSVSVFSLADPLHPVQIQELQLGGPRANATGAGRANVFEIALDPTGRFLFAVTQSTDPAFPQGNQLHTLSVARDGTLSEPLTPVVFATTDVPANAHPQGLAVVHLGGREHDRSDRVFVGFDFRDDDGSDLFAGGRHGGRR